MRFAPTQTNAPRESEDLRRILALPRRPPVEAGSVTARALVVHQTRKFARAETRGCACVKRRGYCITTLRFEQAWALYEMHARRGLLGSIGVGVGKTVINLLAPLAIPDCKVAVLLCPPGVVQQAVVEYELLSEHFEVSSLIVHHPVKLDGNENREYSRLLPGKPVLHIVPYSRLSRPDSTTLLDRLAPDLIIADEAHKLSDRKTTTTTRWLRCMERAKQIPRFVAYSGSLMQGSIREFDHLSTLALGEYSPLPVDPHEGALWAGVVDPVPIPALPGAMAQLCAPGEHVRKALRRRITETQGFITTVEPSADVPLHTRADTTLETPDNVQELITTVERTSERPDGELLCTPLERYECTMQLVSGFFYRWIYPRKEPEELIKTWFERRKAWRQEVRWFLDDNSAEHLDSEYLAMQAGLRGLGAIEANRKLPSWQPVQLLPWLEIKDLVQPKTKAVRVSDFFVQHLAKIAHAQKQIVWYDQQELGEWLAQVSGLERFGGGPHAPAQIAQVRGDRSIIVSIGAHGTGRDGLQYRFDRQYVATPPPGSRIWEQLMGRLHRQGQTRAVWTAYAAHHAALRDSFARALDRAKASADILNSRAKILETNNVVNEA